MNQFILDAQNVEPVNEDDEEDDISSLLNEDTPRVADYENQQEEGEVAVEEKEQGQQLIASENQQEEEKEGQMMAGEKKSQPEDKDAKLPSATANEGKTSQDYSPTFKKTKIAAQADEKDVVLLTSASAFSLQNAAQSMVLIFPSSLPLYVLQQGNATAANHDFICSVSNQKAGAAVSSLHHTFFSQLEQSPGS